MASMNMVRVITTCCHQLKSPTAAAIWRALAMIAFDDVSQRANSGQTCIAAAPARRRCDDLTNNPLDCMSWRLEGSFTKILFLIQEVGVERCKQQHPWHAGRCTGWRSKHLRPQVRLNTSHLSGTFESANACCTQPFKSAVGWTRSQRTSHMARESCRLT
eukprot:3802321-Amphidinium_carterae.1